MKTVSIGTYTREDGTKVYQAHECGMPMHREAETAEEALVIVRYWARSQRDEVVINLWDGDARKETRIATLPAIPMHEWRGSRPDVSINLPDGAAA